MLNQVLYPFQSQLDNGTKRKLKFPKYCNKVILSKISLIFQLLRNAIYPKIKFEVKNSKKSTIKLQNLLVNNAKLVRNSPTVILSNFRKASFKDRIGSYRIFFKNTEKETANQTVKLISNKNKRLILQFIAMLICDILLIYTK